MPVALSSWPLPDGTTTVSPGGAARADSPALSPPTSETARMGASAVRFMTPPIHVRNTIHPEARSDQHRMVF